MPLGLSVRQKSLYKLRSCITGRDVLMLIVLVVERFRYQPHDSTYGEIHEYINYLDHQGMAVSSRA